MRILILCCILLQGIAAERIMEISSKGGIQPSALNGFVSFHVRTGGAETMVYPVAQIRSVTVEKNGNASIHLQRQADDQSITFRVRSAIQDVTSIISAINAASSSRPHVASETMEQDEINGSYRVKPSALNGFINIRKDSFPERDIHVSVAHIGKLHFDNSGSTTIYLRKEFGKSLVSYTIRSSTQKSNDVIALINQAK